jgi:putative component of membrane protein insertase Oxa1/YidC/SpoIIIJ protein YidD
MVEADQVEPEKLHELFAGIEEELFRLPRCRPVPPAGSDGVDGLTRRGSFDCSFPA